MVESGVHDAILSQYHASLGMLRQAVELCPEDLWVSPAYRNRFWHIAYHAAFCTHLYAQPSHAAFRAWSKHVPDTEFLGGRPGAPNETGALTEPYSKADVLEYITLCSTEVDASIPTIRFDDPSGFFWLKFNKIELQFYNLRHLQHHIGQLADRLRNGVGIGLPWLVSGC